MKDEPHIKVREVMSGAVRTVDSMATAREAMAAMAEAGVSSLVVERRDEQDEFGLLGIRDLAQQVVAANRSPDRVNVYEIMSKPVVSLDAEMDIKYAIRLLVRLGLGRGLVIDHERRLVGIATLRDMVLSYAGVRSGES
jgi:predicted transcriptional regulator